LGPAGTVLVAVLCCTGAGSVLEGSGRASFRGRRRIHRESCPNHGMYFLARNFLDQARVDHQSWSFAANYCCGCTYHCSDSTDFAVHGTDFVVAA